MQARFCLLASMLALASCAHPPPPPPPPPPLPPHLGPPAAAECSVAPFKVIDGGTMDVQMTMSSEGGYCAATLTAANGKPFDAPLEPVPPRFGHARVIRYNGKTSVEYTPRGGFTGTDSFTVRLIERGQAGYTTLNVRVTVQAPGTAQAVPGATQAGVPPKA